MILFFFLSPSLLFFGGLKQCGLESLFHHTMSEILHQVIREHFLELLSWDVAVVSSFSVPSDNIQRVKELLCAE